jgi:hypothetical protein
VPKEVAIPRWDHLRVGHNELLQGDPHQTSLPRSGHDVATARPLDDLGVDGADDAGLQTVCSACEIDRRPLVDGHRHQHFIDFRKVASTYFASRWRRSGISI